VSVTAAARPRVPLPVSPYQPRPHAGPGREETLTLRREYLNPGVFHFYKEPLCIVDGHMQYLWDDQGRQYLDAIAGVVTVSVGHCHPKVTAALREQVGRLVHTTTIYLHPNVALLGRELARRMPKGSGLTSTYFTNSGSEANELAILMSRLHTRNHDVLTLRNGYHGGTYLPMSLTAVGTWKFPVSSAGGIKHVAPGYCYRCPFGLKYPSCDVKCARSVEDTIRYETSGQVACFIAEPIQGVGGVVTPPKEYFQIVYEIVRRHGGLCIADEVQTGFGRTGERYWGFENWGVTPDMVTMAKGIANGSPLGACTTRPEIAEQMKQRVHFNTFGGNPVSAAAGLATLAAIDEDGIQQNAKQVGEYLKDKLLGLREKYCGEGSRDRGIEGSTGQGAEGPRDQGTDVRRHEGAEGRRDEGTKARREGAEGRRDEGMKRLGSADAPPLRAARGGGRAGVVIGEVRGLGLMLGVELVKDAQTKEPASAETAQVMDLAKDRGLLLGKGGLYGNVLRIKPPMCITRADCDFLVDCLDECLELINRRATT